MKDGIVYENGFVSVLVKGKNALILNGPDGLEMSVLDLEALSMKIANEVFKRACVKIDFSDCDVDKSKIDEIVNEIYG